MNVLVTGGTGLVGSHVIELLRHNGHTVKAMVRDDIGKEIVERLGATAVFGSVEAADSWESDGDADAIVHSAAIIASRRDWDTFRAVNVDGARYAAMSAARRGIRLIHISSVAVYGRGAGFGRDRIVEGTEWGELSETELYARSKRLAEEAISGIAGETGLSAAYLRPCVVYGERDRTFLPHVVRILRHGYAPLIGPGGNPLAIVYAGNVAEAVLAALLHPEVTGPINVTNDGDVSQREFFTAVGVALGKRTRLIRIPLPVAFAFAATVHRIRRIIAPTLYPGFGPSAVRFLTTDNPYRSDRANNELGWRPSTPPTVAIEKSIRWFALQQARNILR